MLSFELFQVHKEKVEKVPNALPGRNSIELEIYGMEGIPAEDMKNHEKQKLAKGEQQIYNIQYSYDAVEMSKKIFIPTYLCGVAILKRLDFAETWVFTC